MERLLRKFIGLLLIILVIIVVKLMCLCCVWCCLLEGWVFMVFLDFIVVGLWLVGGWL